MTVMFLAVIKVFKARVWLMNKQLGMMVEPLAASKSLVIFLPACIRYAF
ncbi:hypothetical protein CORMATOL_00429 [Corynebacterium matruchotii ATCC 33806]|uniref:Uncharacterized protein n=1 Tax=Corynebacterium matruchotii ATCC 33806 TaxID=566549 RepID=C0E0C9_9CORY|nr:hypothetical protein CORMATOL_00429 [Corynebacterium matruchotii ATCC 33806]